MRVLLVWEVYRYAQMTQLGHLDVKDPPFVHVEPQLARPGPKISRKSRKSSKMHQILGGWTQS
jgi:hypothetical protein